MMLTLSPSSYTFPKDNPILYKAGLVFFRPLPWVMQKTKLIEGSSQKTDRKYTCYHVSDYA
jgi:hypothetical protein